MYVMSYLLFEELSIRVCQSEVLLSNLQNLGEKDKNVVENGL